MMFGGTLCSHLDHICCTWTTHIYTAYIVCVTVCIKCTPYHVNL